MQSLKTALEEVKILVPKVFSDARGFFMECYNQKTINDLLKIDSSFVQDNHSRSTQHVLRGLHYQMTNPQGKIVRVLQGEIFDVAVDMRRTSPTFGKWAGMILSDQNHHMAWIPPGFAHGFLVLSPLADVVYKVTEFYDAQSDRSLLWNDENIGIQWPLVQGVRPRLSEKDLAGAGLQKAECYDG